MKALILILALISFNVESRLIKSEPTLSIITSCVQYINRVQLSVHYGKLSINQAKFKMKGCKAAINRYDATELAMRMKLSESIRELIK